MGFKKRPTIARRRKTTGTTLPANTVEAAPQPLDADNQEAKAADDEVDSSSEAPSEQVADGEPVEELTASGEPAADAPESDAGDEDEQESVSENESEGGEASAEPESAEVAQAGESKGGEPESDGTPVEAASATSQSEPAETPSGADAKTDANESSVDDLVDNEYYKEALSEDIDFRRGTVDWRSAGYAVMVGSDAAYRDDEDEDEESDAGDSIGLAEHGPTSLDDYVEGLDESLGAIVRRLGELIRDVVDHVSEGIRWGMPHYSLGGHLVYIDAKQDHVNLGFFRGDELAEHVDARSLFLGAGGKLRHIKLYSVHTIPERAVRALVEAAVALNRGSTRL